MIFNEVKVKGGQLLLNYDGKGYSISNVATNIDYAGLFGIFGEDDKATSVSNLQLLDFSVTGSSSAGALAGKLIGTTVTNVLARNSGAGSTVNVLASNAGGLIGVQDGGNVNRCAAAVFVKGSMCAGGLIGTADATITGCYSGGHTKNGSYLEWINGYIYDVDGGTVGGLVGNAGGSTITSCYSTCSATGSVAVGGFAGVADDSDISHCYCTGLVTRNSEIIAKIMEKYNLTQADAETYVLAPA